MTEEELELEAKELFRIVNGPGDGGSEREFYASDRSGWIKLARLVTRRIRRAKPLKIVSGNDAMVSTMEKLRKDGWCVVLKCLPRDLAWTIEGSRSEYDSPCPDRKVGRGKWVAELQNMNRHETGKCRWRGSPFALADTAAEAIEKVVALAKTQ